MSYSRKRFNSKKHEAARSAAKEAAQAVLQSELANVAEAAMFLRVSTKTVRRRVKAGTVSGRKLGGEWRFPWVKLRELAGVQ